MTARNDSLAIVVGIACALPVAAWALVQQLLPASPFATHSLAWAAEQAFIHAAIPEETIKLLALIWLFRAEKSRDPRAGLRTGALLGLGFAVVETLLHAAVGDAWRAAAVRLVSSIPCHVALGVIMAAYLARRGAGAPLVAWGLAVLCHGLYNLPLLMPRTPPFAGAPPPMLLSLTVLAFVVLWARDLTQPTSHQHKIDQAPVDAAA
jgi:RsiW-degrading membrane proteinase PrsW (M82 family)